MTSAAGAGPAGSLAAWRLFKAARAGRAAALLTGSLTVLRPPRRQCCSRAPRLLRLTIMIMPVMPVPVGARRGRMPLACSDGQGPQTGIVPVTRTGPGPGLACGVTVTKPANLNRQCHCIWKNEPRGYPGISRDNPMWCLSRDNPG